MAGLGQKHRCPPCGPHVWTSSNSGRARPRCMCVRAGGRLEVGASGSYWALINRQRACSNRPTPIAVVPASERRNRVLFELSAVAVVGHGLWRLLSACSARVRSTNRHALEESPRTSGSLRQTPFSGSPTLRYASADIDVNVVFWGTPRGGTRAHQKVFLCRTRPNHRPRARRANGISLHRRLYRCMSVPAPTPGGRTAMGHTQTPDHVDGRARARRAPR